MDEVGEVIRPWSRSIRRSRGCKVRLIGDPIRQFAALLPSQLSCSFLLCLLALFDTMLSNGPSVLCCSPWEDMQEQQPMNPLVLLTHRCDAAQ